MTDSGGIRGAGEVQARDKLAEVIGRITSFRREIRPELEDSLNGYLKSLPPQSAAEKKATADTVKKLLAPLNFAIERDGHPCLFYAISSKKNPHGHFRLQAKAARTPLAYFSTLSDLLPLHLVDISPQASLSLGDQQSRSSPEAIDWKTRVGTSNKSRSID